MQKRVIAIFCIVLSLFLITGCTNLNSPVENKTEFSLNEEAKIDHFKIVLNDIAESDHFQDVRPEKDTYLVLEFKITNNSTETQVIKAGNSFRLMIEESSYTDLNHNKDITIEPNESIMYQTIFDVPEQDSYNIYFYSGVVTNNIKFITK